MSWRKPTDPPLWKIQILNHTYKNKSKVITLLKSEYNDALTWLRKKGKINKDYTILNAEQSFVVTKNNGPQTEVVDKTQALIQTIKDAE